MSSNHTPGKWVATGEDNGRMIMVRTEDGLLIAGCRYSDNPRCNKEIAKANALIIESAPEMLELLQQIVEPYADKDNVPIPILKAHQLLAKIEGE